MKIKYINQKQQIKQNKKQINIINFSNLEETNNIGLHKVKEDKNELIFDLLKDIYLLYLSENLIGSPQSSISRLLFYMRNKKTNDNIFTI